jgi:hypothetical protein
MSIIVRVVAAGVLGGIALAILWALFFTIVVDWPGHELFITVVFLFGALGTTMLSLKGTVW